MICNINIPYKKDRKRVLKTWLFAGTARFVNEIWISGSSCASSLWLHLKCAHWTQTQENSRQIDSEHYYKSKISKFVSLLKVR